MSLEGAYKHKYLYYGKSIVLEIDLDKNDGEIRDCRGQYF